MFSFRQSLRMLGKCFAIFSCLVATTVLAAEPNADVLENWPQWRGPLANGISPHGNPPLEWSETKNIRWKVEVPGRGSATPIVWNEKLFVLTAIPTDRPGPATDKKEELSGQRKGRKMSLDTPTTIYEFCVFCYDRNSGKELWKKVAREEVPHEGGHATNTFASGSPITDGKRLYASFGSYGTYCYDLDGNLLWERDLGDMRTRASFGEGGSPALHENTLIVPWDHEGQSAIYALNATTGKTLWTDQRDEPTGWSTPLIVEGQKYTQVITNGTNRVRSYDITNGELIWECGGQVVNTIPSPVSIDGLVICMTGYRGYAVYAIPLSARGDITDTDTIRWHRRDAGPYISSPVIVNGSLYFTKSRDAILYSVDALTGQEQIDSKRIPKMGTLYASPVAAQGRLYYCDRSGTTVVIKASKKLEVLATNHLEDVLDASPVIVGNQLFLRGEKTLYCIQE